MPDKFSIYRPMLDLIGFTEGTDPSAGKGGRIGLCVVLVGGKRRERPRLRSG